MNKQKLNEKFEQIEDDAIKYVKQRVRALKNEVIRIREEGVIYVPECIKIRGGNNTVDGYSVTVLNDEEQGLYKNVYRESFTVNNGYTSENIGSNYRLEKRDTIEDGKLYFVTDFNPDASEFENRLNWLQCYKVGLGDGKYAFWNIGSNSTISVQSFDWSYIFEVVKEE